VLAEEPLLAADLDLVVLADPFLFRAMASIELLLPGEEGLDGDGSEGRELGPFEDLLLLGEVGLLDLEGFALDEVLVDPIAGFLDDVEDDGLLLTVADNVLDLLGDGVDVVAGDADDGLELVAEGSEGVLLGELEHEVDLELQGVALVGFAEHVELVGCRLLHHLELLQIDILQGRELVLLLSQVLHFHTTNDNNNMAFVS
jgi:hypothetical protein